MPRDMGICLGQQADWAANSWLASCNRGNGNNVTYVNSSGNCSNTNAMNAYRPCPDRVETGRTAYA